MYLNTEKPMICAVCKNYLYGEHEHNSTKDFICALSKKDLIRLLTCLLIIGEMFLIAIILSKLYGGIF